MSRVTATLKVGVHMLVAKLLAYGNGKCLGMAF